MFEFRNNTGQERQILFRSAPLLERQQYNDGLLTEGGTERGCYILKAAMIEVPTRVVRLKRAEEGVGENSNTGNSIFGLKNDRAGPMKATESPLELFIDLRKCAVTYRTLDSRIWDRNCRAGWSELGCRRLGSEVHALLSSSRSQDISERRAWKGQYTNVKIKFFKHANEDLRVSRGLESTMNGVTLWFCSLTKS